MKTRFLFMVAAATLAAVGFALTATAAPAKPVPVDKKLSFTCPFPLIGLQKLDVEVKASFEVPDAVGGAFSTSDLAIAVTVPDKAARGLNLVDAATIEGTAKAGVTLTNGDGKPLPLQLPLTVAKTDIPKTGTFTTNATGAVPTVNLPKPGKTTLVIGDFTTRLTPKKADGSFTGIGAFTSDCTLDAGQDPVLLSFDLGGQPPGGGAHDFKVSGRTELKSLGSTAPFTGKAAITEDNGAFTGTFAIDPMTVDFRLFGFLPGTASARITQHGPATGDRTAAHLGFTVGLPAISVLGLPVSGDPACAAETPVKADLVAAEGFDPATGGTLNGTYSLPAVANCGAFTGYVSTLTKSDGNTLSFTLAA
ncbi:DUF6801 domain-containing protein [Amycolatopsis minnesotensis]|uniref:DUF6801 domain-containing protein n=1 Tax=Amycolatopsis minnesotensis TaxID=337894 RepID=A0ABN2RRP5_9PSEU